jgi:hypothetical protein
VGTASCQVKLDSLPPRTRDDAPTAPSSVPVTVTLTPTDANSGAAHTYWSTDGVTWNEGTSVFIDAPAGGGNDGIHWIYYYSVDNTGNVETLRLVPVTIQTI